MILKKSVVLTNGAGNSVLLPLHIAGSPVIDQMEGIEHGFLAKNSELFSGYERQEVDFRHPTLSDKVISQDEKLQRKRSFHILSSYLDIDQSRCVTHKPVHGTEIVRISQSGNELSKPVWIRDVDGLVTNLPRVALLALAADCPTILVYDPVKRAIGVAHSGKVGTEKGMPKVLVKKMQEEFGSDVSDLVVYVSPAAQQQSYATFPRENVDFPEEFCQNLNALEVYQKLILPQWRIDDILREEELVLSLVDVPGYIKQQLLESGVKEENITVSKIDTMTSSFASFRRDGKDKYSNTALFAMLT